MVIQVPTSFTAGRKVVLDGVTYQPGANVPNAVVKKIRNVSSLLSNRFLIPNVDPFSRKTKASTPRPNDLSVKISKDL